MIKISYQEDCEMMVVEDNGCVVFYGNYWDFDKSPQGLGKFLALLDGLEVEVKEAVLIP